MIHGLYIPSVFRRNNNEYRIKQFNFQPAVESGVKFVVIEANESFSQHNKYFADAVQAAYDAGVKVVIALFQNDPPKYYDLYNDPHAWTVNNFDLNDVFLKQVYNALRSGPNAGQGKFIHGVVLEFVNTAQKDGNDLMESWWVKIFDRTMNRVRDYSAWINWRLDEESIFPLVEQKIMDDHYPSLYNVMEKEPWVCAGFPYLSTIHLTTGYKTTFQRADIPEWGPTQFTGAKDWLFWRWGRAISIDPNFRYEDGKPGIVGAVAFHGEERHLLERFRPDLVVPPVVPPVEPEPEEPPVVEPEPEPEDMIGEALADIADGLQAIFNAVCRIAEEREK